MECIVAENGVVFYRSKLIPCIHGFSTRIGGVSKLPHTRGLNLGVGRGDSIDTVLDNLEIFSDALGIDAKSVISVSQIHSSNIRYVDNDECGEGFFKKEGEPCDGYITSSFDVTLGVRTADCVPILLYAPPNNKFCGAVSAIHAGWRGTALGISGKAVSELCRMGAEASEIRAAIGPAIEKCCYFVRDDFYESFCSMAGKDIADKYVLPIGDHTWVADLKGVNRALLISCGLAEENIDVCDKCTCCNPDEFYSHRYSKGMRGTMLSVISMNKKQGEQ